MVAIYILGALLLIILLILLIRVGVQVHLDGSVQVLLRIGPCKIQLIPSKKSDKPKKEKKAKKENKKKKEEPAEGEDESGKGKKKGLPLGMTFEDIKEAFPYLMESLQKGLHKTRKRVRVHPMYAEVIFGGNDPCKVSEMYGWASVAMWTYMPHLEEFLNMPDPEIHLNVDFGEEKTNAKLHMGISLLILDGLTIGLAFGIPLIKWFMGFKKKQKKRVKEETKINEKVA